MKNLPIGIQTFSILRENDYCYVDKTPLIARLVEQGRYYFLSRPRRFGKSLLVSTLDAAFSGERQWFTGLYLDTHWDWASRYPVIRFDFSAGIVTERAALESKIRQQLDENAEKYGVELTYPEVSSRFQQLIRSVHKKAGQRVVVLVDEYDKPILDNLEQAEVARVMREGLKSLYAVLKSQDAHLHFVFLTGVSKFSKVSIFSGLNNLEDITLDARFGTLCGYTEAELTTVFAEYLGNVDLAEVRVWYNGYYFLGEPVYNPFDILLYLRNYQFQNYWFETGNPSFLVKLLAQKKYCLPDLEKIRTSESLLSHFDIEAINLETILFQAGYLTIRETIQQGARRVYRLGYPNQEVKMSFTESALHYFSQASLATQNNLSRLYDLLAADDFDSLREVFQAFFASIPHDWYRKNQLAGYEGYYASIVYCYFAALGLNVIAEDVTNHGQIDLTVRLDDRMYLIEFKVVSGTVPGNPALQQLKARDYARKYQGRRVYLLGVVFDKQERNIVAFDWEAQG